jgi:hypothetical protein
LIQPPLTPSRVLKNPCLVSRIVSIISESNRNREHFVVVTLRTVGDVTTTHVVKS